MKLPAAHAAQALALRELRGIKAEANKTKKVNAFSAFFLDLPDSKLYHFIHNKIM
jgi:hypothetical protein